MRTVHVLVVAALVAAPDRSIAEGGQARNAAPQPPAGTVTLSVADYDRLIDRAAQPPARPEPPPVAAVVARAELRARVDGATARGTLRLEGEVFRRGQIKVPLVTGATLLDARADGRTLPLLQEGDSHSAIFRGPAPFTATLDWAAALGAAPGRASLTLPQAASGSVTTILDLPGEPADIRVEPGLIARRQTSGSRTTVEITTVAGRRTQVSWSVRETAPPGQPAEARLLADLKSLVTLGEADIRLVTLVDITVVRGEPGSFEVHTPAGYELVSVTGGSLDRYDAKGDAITLTLREPARRRHQVLVSLERPHSPGSFKADTSFPTVPGAQRETGEVAIEGTGTMEVDASGDEGLRRMDVREVHASLRSLTRQPLLAAFRYQRRPNEARRMTVDVRRFADAPVLAAAAERAVATTLVTSEGRMLTEVSLQIRNRAQPFMKVSLPAGATMLSVEVGGETAKPVSGTDGTRIPLLRAGFRPDGPYSVSFVYLHAGQAMAKRGEAQMVLPTVDVPLNLLEWEVFLPEQYTAKPVDGNVIPASLSGWREEFSGSGYGAGAGAGSGAGAGIGGRSSVSFAAGVPPGQIVGRVTDAAGGAIPGATITLTDGAIRMAVTSKADGTYVIAGAPTGQVTVSSQLAGFHTSQTTFAFDQTARRVDFQMEVAALVETVTVRAEAERPSTSVDQVQQQAPSQNIINMQRRVAGVLPVRVDVPRAGTSYRFVRPLVLEDETRVKFRYKNR
jgi:hypothetical protein